ncbi:MAG: hypothetical protein E6H41_12875 [Betaproteobacteria bacterium]|nr:MAG: hypothetical protein E6H41_12875 [Betaproteobacteria bacterium]
MKNLAIFGEYAVIVLVVGWPMLLIASVSLAAYLHKRRITALRALCAVGLAWPFTVLVALVIWRWWPESFGAPMLAFYVHGPALLATLVVFPLIGWRTKITLRPTNALAVCSHPNTTDQ